MASRCSRSASCRSPCSACACLPSSRSEPGRGLGKEDNAGQDLSEHFVSGEEVFSGRLLTVRRDTVRMPDGALVTREYIRHPGAVAILPFTAEGNVILERQFR